MPVKPIPEGFQTVTPYLAVPNAGRVVEFAQAVFGAQELPGRMTTPDGRLMHTEVKIGGSVVMLGEPPAGQPSATAMLYVYVPDVDAAYQRALAAGAESLREPADQFYGDRSAAVRDAGGNQWYIATHIEDVSPEEMQRRAAAHAPA